MTKIYIAAYKEFNDYATLKKICDFFLQNLNKNDVLFYMKPASLILIFLLILANAFITASKQAQIKSKPGKSTERHLDGTEGDTNYIVVYYNDKTEYTNYKEGAAMK